MTPPETKRPERGHLREKNPQKNPRRALGKRLEPGNPGNSGGKKGRSGRPPDWLKQEMARGRESCVRNLVRKASKGKLDADQELRLVKEWTPAEEQLLGGQVLRVVWSRE
jgi:hypothetical protein